MSLYGTEEYLVILLSLKPAHAIIIAYSQPMVAQESLHICAVSPEPTLLSLTKYLSD